MVMSTKVLKNHLVMAVDPGASLIKIVGSLAGEEICVPLSIDPYCVEIESVTPDSNFDHNSVWVEIGGVKYAVGNLANAKYECSFDLRQLKIDSIVPKICAAVAVMHKKLNLPKTFNLSLISVLPPGERSYKDDFTNRLLEAFKNIITPAGVIKPIVKSLDIYPEGYGVMSWHTNFGVASNNNIAVVMLGFRNTSVLFAMKKQLSKVISSDLGFSQVLKKVSETSGGSYSTTDLINPVCNYLRDGDVSRFNPICRSTNREGEISRIKTATDNAVAEYQRRLEKWLIDVWQPTDISIMCGGTAEYVGSKLKPFLEKYTNKDATGMSVFTGVGEQYVADELIKTGMPNRYLDIYCLWKRDGDLKKI
jgi:hypothetical protein